MSIHKNFAAAFAVILTMAAAPAFAADHNVEIINQSGSTLKHFYASVTSETSWQEDILGRDVLENGETFKVDINDGSGKCHYDFKGVFADGSEHIANDINVCEISTYTYR